MGCDGSRIECPRTPELGRGLGQAGKKDAAPTVWLTAFVHLPAGLLRSWRLGPGTAAEQEHLRSLLATLSAEALIVCDAASMGFEPVRAILGARRSFLFRMSSRVDLYTPSKRRAWRAGPKAPSCTGRSMSRREGSRRSDAA